MRPVAAATSTRSRAARLYLRQQRGRLPRCSSPQTHPNFAVLRHVGALTPGGTRGLLRPTPTHQGLHAGCGSCWRYVTGDGAVEAAPHELFRYSVRPVPLHAGSPGGECNICSSKTHTLGREANMLLRFRENWPALQNTTPPGGRCGTLNCSKTRYSPSMKMCVYSNGYLFCRFLSRKLFN